MKNQTKWMNFLGGRNTVYTLVVIILLGLAILLGRELDFLFYPLIVLFSNILLPVVIALLLFYLINPLVSWFEKRGLKRLPAILLVIVIVIAVITVALIFIIPALTDQIMGFVDYFPQLIENIIDWGQRILVRFHETPALAGFLEEIENALTDLPQYFDTFISSGLSRVSSVIASVTNVVFIIVMIPIILFFLLKDHERMLDSFMGVLPPKWRPEVSMVLSEMNDQVSNYIKGQLLVAVSVGLMMGLGLSIIGLPYSWVIGLITMVTAIIPYIGPTIAFLLALVIAIFDSWFMIFKLVIVWIVVQFIDGNIIEPNIMGQQLNAHPLTIMIVLIIAGDLMGLFGLIFGVPMYAILKVLVLYLFEKFKKRYNNHFAEGNKEYEVKQVEELEGPVSEEE